jgi:hypothetical protein
MVQGTGVMNQGKFVSFQGIFVNIQGTFRQHCDIIQGKFVFIHAVCHHSREICSQGTFVNIREHSGSI